MKVFMRNDFKALLARHPELAPALQPAYVKAVRIKMLDKHCIDVAIYKYGNWIEHRVVLDAMEVV